MREHIKVLGIIHIVFGCLGLLGAMALGGIFAFGGTIISLAGHHDRDSLIALSVLGAVGTALFVLFLVLSVPGIVAGWGLLNFKPWARILTIVLSALDLLNFPVGTAIGVYGLWVLLNQETEAMFRGAPPPVMPPRAA
jgi:O-antigen/teichoic acid export membrane protein